MQNYGGISRYFANLYNDFNSIETLSCKISMLYSENYFAEKIDHPQHIKWAKPLFGKSKSRINRWNRRYNSLMLPFADCDVFHPTYYDSYYIKKVKKPVVITIHDMIYEKMPDFFPDSTQIINNKQRVAEHADAIICISESAKIDLMNHLSLDESKIHVVYHGLFNSFNDENDNLERTELPNNYVLFVGERKTYKNFIRFIEAFKNLLHKESSLHLICAGGGSYTSAEVELLNKYKIYNQCHQISPGDALLKQLYQKAAAFIFPSLYEGFGLPILEAFDAGCPVVMSNTNVFKEVGGHAALYFDPYDEEDIEDKISKVLFSTHQQAGMKEKGKERLKLFSAKTCVEQTIQIYKTLL